MELAGKVVVVTGGGSGIGEAIALAAHAEGASHVVVADRNLAQAGRVAAAIGAGASAAAIDVADEAAIQRLVTETQAAHGPIGLFVSNAGYIVDGGLELPNDVVRAMFDVHVMAHLYAARAVIPSMAAAGGGYLLNTASAAGLLMQLGSLPYTVTKHAAVALGEYLAVTHHHQGIRVSVLCPQAVATNILVNSPDEAVRATGSFDGSAAGGDGVRSPAEVATACIDAIRDERFLVLPHPEVNAYVQRKAADEDRWLAGMRRFQSTLYEGRPLPGDALL